MGDGKVQRSRSSCTRVQRLRQHLRSITKVVGVPIGRLEHPDRPLRDGLEGF